MPRRAAARGRRARRGRHDRGPRHGHARRRPRRADVADVGLRRRRQPLRARVGEDEPRPHRGRRRHGRAAQGRPRRPSRRGPRLAALPQLPAEIEGADGRLFVPTETHRVAASRGTADRGRVLLRLRRHERARHRRAAASRPAREVRAREPSGAARSCCRRDRRTRSKPRRRASPAGSPGPDRDDAARRRRPHPGAAPQPRRGAPGGARELQGGPRRGDCGRTPAARRTPTSSATTCATRTARDPSGSSAATARSGRAWAGTSSSATPTSPASSRRSTRSSSPRPGSRRASCCAPATPVTRVDKVQPLIFTMQVALATALRARGVQPAAVVGLSVGEVAAAVVAGGLSSPTA